jgi:hypothetical protein
VTPAGAGPHGIVVTDVVEAELMDGAARLDVYPSPLRVRDTATILARDSRGAETGRMLVFDARGRTVRMLRSVPDGAGRVRAVWNGTDKRGEPVPAGVYFLRWQAGRERAAAKLVVLD